MHLHHKKNSVADTATIDFMRFRIQKRALEGELVQFIRDREHGKKTSAEDLKRLQSEIRQLETIVKQSYQDKVVGISRSQVGRALRLMYWYDIDYVCCVTA